MFSIMIRAGKDSVSQMLPLERACVWSGPYASKDTAEQIM